MNITRNPKKDTGKMHVKGIQIFLKKKKRQRKVRERYQNLSEKQDQKSYLSILEIIT